MAKIETRLGALEARVRRLTLLAALALVGSIGILALQTLPQETRVEASETTGNTGLRVETGTLMIKSDRIWTLDKPSGCGGHRGDKRRRVDFAESFSSPPQIALGLTTFDLVDTGGDYRIWLSVEEVTPDFFTYTFTTWCDTALSLAKANWIAGGR